MSLERVTFGQRDRAGLLFGLQRTSLVALGLAAGLLLVGLVTRGLAGMALALVVAGPLGAAALVRVQGRAAVEWAPVAVVWRWRRRGDQARYVLGPRVAEVGDLVLPGRCARLRLLAGPDGVAVVEDPASGSLSCSARVTHQPFLLAGSTSQERRVEGWGAVLAELGQMPGLARLQVLERALPDSPDALAAHFAAHGAHNTSAADAYRELIWSAGPAAERHEAYLTWTWSRRSLDRDVRRAGGGALGLGAVLGQRMAWVESVLRTAELSLSSWLSPRDLSGVLHSAYDPAWRPAGDGCDPSGAGPQAMEERWDHLRSDSGLHVSYRVAEWPRLAVGPDVLAPVVLASGVRRSWTLVVEPVPPGRAEREIRAAKAEHAAEADAKARIGQVRSQREDARLSDVLRREAELVAGHVELRYAGLLSVSATDEAGLEAACVAVEQAARRSQLELRRLYGQQAQGFAAAALPLGLAVLQGSRR
jgi:hypothetical protein